MPHVFSMATEMLPNLSDLLKEVFFPDLLTGAFVVDLSTAMLSWPSV